MEGRPLAKKNTDMPNSCRTLDRESESSGLDRVRQAAKQDKEKRFTALLHHVSIQLLESIFESASATRA